MSEDHFRVERWRRGRNKTEMFADTLIEWLGLGTNDVISSLDSNLRLGLSHGRFSTVKALGMVGTWDKLCC